VDLQPWMAQIGLGAAAVALFLTVGKSYVNYIGKQLTEARMQHKEEIQRLTTSWEARLSDAVRRAEAWETAAYRYEQANRESVEHERKLSSGVNETAVALLTAIRDEQGRT
jgi:hypothetical protein